MTNRIFSIWHQRKNLSIFCKKKNSKRFLDPKKLIFLNMFLYHFVALFTFFLKIASKISISQILSKYTPATEKFAQKITKSFNQGPKRYIYKTPIASYLVSN